MILFLDLEIWWNSNIVTQKMTQSLKRVFFFRGKLQSYFDYFYDWWFRYFQEDYDKQMNSPEASDDPYVSLILTVSVNDYDKNWLFIRSELTMPIWTIKWISLPHQVHPAYALYRLQRPVSHQWSWNHQIW